MRKLLTLIAMMVICNAYGETVYWLTDGDVYEKTPCDSGNNVTMPTQGNPQKEGGFRFIGWKEGSVYDFLATNGTSYTPDRRTTDDTWTVTLSWGTVTGKARCSSTSAPANTSSCWNDENCTTNANPTTTDTTPNNGVIDYSNNTDKYCWCKLTDSDGLVDVSSLAWVFIADDGSSSAPECAATCALLCSGRVRVYPGLRRAVFGVTQ